MSIIVMSIYFICSYGKIGTFSAGFQIVFILFQLIRFERSVLKRASFFVMTVNNIDER